MCSIVAITINIPQTISLAQHYSVRQYTWVFLGAVLLAYVPIKKWLSSMTIRHALISGGLPFTESIDGGRRDRDASPRMIEGPEKDFSGCRNR